MAEFLDREQYASLQQALSTGQAAFAFERSFARRFFTHVGQRNVRDLTGQSVRLQKLVIFSVLLLSIVLLAICLWSVYTGFGMTGLMAAAVIGIFWTILAGFTTELGSMFSSTVILAAALLLAWFVPFDYGLPITLFATSVYAYRVGHILSFHFLSRLIATSYDAYDMLYEQIDVNRE